MDIDDRLKHLQDEVSEVIHDMKMGHKGLAYINKWLYTLEHALEQSKKENY